MSQNGIDFWGDSQNKQQFLLRASKVLASSLDYEQTLRNFVRLVVPTLADYAVVHLLNEHQDAYAVEALHRNPEQLPILHELLARYPPDYRSNTPASQALQSGQAILVPETGPDKYPTITRDADQLEMTRQLGPRSYVVAPLQVRQQTFGVLTCVLSESSYRYSDRDLEFIQELAHYASVAVDNARLYYLAQEEIRRREAIEHDLRESEQRLRLITDSLPVLISYVDSEVRYQSNNKTYEDWFGFTQDEVKGRAMWEILGNAAYERIRPYVERALAGEPAYYEALLIPYQTAGARYVDAAYIPDKDAQGRVRGFIVLVSDVTERQHLRMREQAAYERAVLLANASAALTASLEYETTLNSMARLAVANLADCCIVYLVEGEEAKRVAAAHRDAGKQSLLDQVHEHYPLTLDSPVARTIRMGQTVGNLELTDSILQDMAANEVHLALLRALEFRFAMFVPLKLRGDAFGALLLLSAQVDKPYTEDDLILAEELAHRAATAVENAQLYRDLQQLADRMARLQEVTATLSQALTTAQVAEIVLSQALAVVGAASGGMVMLTADRSELEIVYSTNVPPELVAQYKRYAVDAGTSSAEAVRTREPVWVRSREERARRFPDIAETEPDRHAWAALPLIVDDTVIGTLSLSFSTPRDFSEQDRAFLMALAWQCAQAIHRATLLESEQQALIEARAAIKLRDEFLSTAAHELKTPLTSLRGFTQNLLRYLGRPEPPDLKRIAQNLEMIDRQSVRMAQLINQLLEIARYQMGQFSLEMQTVDAAAIVREAAVMAQAGTTRHTIAVTAPETLLLHADPLRLEQVITNLIGNAIKYSPKGGPIEVRLAVEDQRLHLVVRDWGLGIPPEHLDRIFEQYYQAHKGMTASGMGLGLFISRQIIKLHGGQITVDCPADGGTLFTVTLPLAPTDSTVT